MLILVPILSKNTPNKPATRASKAAEPKGAIYIWIDPDKSLQNM